VNGAGDAFRLDGRESLVTGAAQGIGAAAMITGQVLHVDGGSTLG